MRLIRPGLQEYSEGVNIHIYLPKPDDLEQCSIYDPVQMFLTSKFSYLLFLNPHRKTKTGTAIRWEESTNSNPLGPIKLSNQSTAGVRLAVPVTQFSKQREFATE